VPSPGPRRQWSGRWRPWPCPSTRRTTSQDPAAGAAGPGRQCSAPPRPAGRWAWHGASAFCRRSRHWWLDCRTSRLAVWQWSRGWGEGEIVLEIVFRYVTQGSTVSGTLCDCIGLHNLLLARYREGELCFLYYAYRDWLDLLVWFFGFGFWLTMIRFLDFLMMFVSSDTYIYIYRYIYLNTS